MSEEEGKQIRAMAEWVRQHAGELAVSFLEELVKTSDGYEPPTTRRRYWHDAAADICNDLAGQRDDLGEQFPPSRRTYDNDAEALRVEYERHLGVPTRRVMT